ncbi:hypothetical protein [Paenibacillus sp. FSL R7-0273]|uniref:hypothetical protein n=1 Tax=Paenibacillus sp. FSL R7-0273 TaxID=1536772 RepID=UPI0006942E80|nr:hypothetical protein [Paenibacillus sp. FSL R7-0273]
MDKKEDKLEQLQDWLQSSDGGQQLEEYLLQNSGLPGPRANLALAARFARYYSKPEITGTAWSLIIKWAGEPGEYLPFCAVQACAAHYSYADNEHRRQIRGILRTAMNDSGWRVREAAAIGLQLIGENDFSLLQELLDSWRPEASVLEQRAFLAGLAHPPLLESRSQVLYCLDLAEEITDAILQGKTAGCDPEHFRVLSKGLEYCLSLFAAAEPEAGFAMLRRLIESRDPRILRLVKANLGKARLSKKYPEQVQQLLAGLTTV